MDVVQHEEYGSLIHDAIPDINLPMEENYSSATLGHLEPRRDLVDPHKSEHGVAHQ